MLTSDHVLIETWYLASCRLGSGVADVLIETWYLASCRLGSGVAETLLNRIRSGVARVEPATLADLEVAARIHEALPDQGFSIVDRTSWSVMQRLGIHDAIAFDRDFSIYRFGPDRRRAFTVYT